VSPIRVLVDLERLVDEDRRGDPELLLLWTSKSVRRLASGLRDLGHEVEYVTVAKLLRSAGYSLQANVKTREGRQHPDRDLQFRRINTTCRQALHDREPIISIDCKKKELVGDFKNSGRSAGGGSTSAKSATPTRRACRSPPTAAGPTATGSGCGRSSCRPSRRRPAWRSTSATYRRERRSGTRSSTACSPTSR
jgi:hypothetical protein